MAAPLLIALVSIVLAAGLFYVAWRNYRKRRLIADTPTSTVQGMAVGAVELKGVAVPRPGASPVVGPLSKEPCVAYRWSIEEQRTRTVTERQGNRTVTRTETYWETIKSGGDVPPHIGLQDPTGVALIATKGAPLPFPATTRHGSSLGRDPPPVVLDFLRGQNVTFEGWFGLNKTMRFTERRLPVEWKLYVLGTAIRRDDAPKDAVGNEALVVQGEGEVPFLIHDKEESSLTRRYAVYFWLCFLGGLAAAGVATWVLTGA